jgi:hypothetical protein
VTSRRSFLGTTVGISLISALPLVARTGSGIIPFEDELNAVERRVKLMRAGGGGCKLYLRLSDGEVIRGPVIHRVDQSADKMVLAIRGEPLEIRVRDLSLTGVIVINDKRELICDRRFDAPLHWSMADVLRTDVTLSLVR